MYQVRGKWALVTGAARGIGRLTAEYLADMGCNLILHSRSLAHTGSLLQSVRAKGVSCYAVAADLGDPEQVAKMLSEIDALGMVVDIVLNNAGVQVAYRTEYFATPVSDFTVSFNVNTVAPAMICYHFLPRMIQRGSGRVVNTTSGIALDVCQAGYSASKAALDKITVDLGSRVDGTDVMISLADPGWCRTDLGGPHAPNAPESAIPGILAGVFADDRKSGRRFGAQDFTGLTPEEIARRVERDYLSPYGNK